MFTESPYVRTFAAAVCHTGMTFLLAQQMSCRQDILCVRRGFPYVRKFPVIRKTSRRQEFVYPHKQFNRAPCVTLQLPAASCES